MRVLQVASFRGNVGDIANHYGFRQWFESFFEECVSWSEFEIRKVFRRELQFDQSFVDLANQFDLLVIGGGNFFELWVENSPTGTSISLEKKYLDQISVPIFINAIGVDDGMGVTAGTLAKFNAFLESLVKSKKSLVSVRNDGAYTNLTKYVTNRSLLENVIALPDGGFFATLPKSRTLTSLDEFPVIGINLAGDMPDIRFKASKDSHSYKSFLEEFSEYVNEITLIWPKAKFLFFPHIYSDLRIISNLFDLLSDDVRRNNCRVEAYDSSISFENSVFNAYTKCNIVLGMRFHSNVLAIANKIPVVGLNCYKQIEALYTELGAEDYSVDVKQKGFHKQLIALTSTYINEPKNISRLWKKILKQILQDRQNAETRIRDWLKKHKYNLKHVNATQNH